MYHCLNFRFELLFFLVTIDESQQPYQDTHIHVFEFANNSILYAKKYAHDLFRYPLTRGSNYNMLPLNQALYESLVMRLWKRLLVGTNHVYIKSKPGCDWWRAFA